MVYLFITNAPYFYDNRNLNVLHFFIVLVYTIIVHSQGHHCEEKSVLKAKIWYFKAVFLVQSDFYYAIICLRQAVFGFA